MLTPHTAARAQSTSYIGLWLLRALLILGLLGLVVTAHLPTHLASAVGRLARQPQWIDALRLDPPLFTTLFWLPAALLALAFAIRNRGAAVPAEAAGLARRDLVIALAVAVLAIAVRAWPLLQNAWIKPDFDEGVYLGGAWLMRGGALPYRDFVLAHPPGALLLLWPATLLLHAGQDNTAGVLAARLIAILCDGAAAGLLYLAARQLTAWPGALLAAVVYAADALALGFSRGVRLEPLQAPFLAAGAALLLGALNGRRWAFASGACFALAVLVKVTGGVAPLAAVLLLMIERRWRPLRDLVLGGLVAALVVAAPFVLTSGDEIVRQVLLLQLARPADPATGRWAFLLANQSTALTALALVAGLGVVTLRAARGRVASGWLFAALWLALTLAMFAYAASFYDHYYVQLALPAALCAAGVGGLLSSSRRRLLQLALPALLAALLGWGQARLWLAVSRPPAIRAETDAVLALPPDARLVNFMPFTNLLAGDPFVRPEGGPYILDTFLGTIYLDSPLNRRWPDATAVMGAAIALSDTVVVDPWTAPLPGLLESFQEQPLIEGSRTRLFRRVDQPADVLQAGADLQLMRRTPPRVETADGQRWLVVPLHWRASRTPAPDQALALHLDRDGQRVAQLDVPISGGIEWRPGVVNTLEYRVPLPADLAPGTYNLSAVLYSWTTGATTQLAPLDGSPPIAELHVAPVELGP